MILYKNLLLASRRIDNLTSSTITSSPRLITTVSSLFLSYSKDATNCLCLLKYWSGMGRVSDIKITLLGHWWVTTYQHQSPNDHFRFIFNPTEESLTPRHSFPSYDLIKFCLLFTTANVRLTASSIRSRIIPLEYLIQKTSANTQIMIKLSIATFDNVILD